MIITATQKYIRQTPRKLRLVVNAVKDLPLEQAVRQLSVIERRASLVVMKVLKQAVANAVNNHGLAVADLGIKSITVNEGPRYKRFQAVSRGRAHSILKTTSHVKVELATRDELVKGKKEKAKEVAAPVESSVSKEASPATTPKSTKTKTTKATKSVAKKK